MHELISVWKPTAIRLLPTLSRRRDARCGLPLRLGPSPGACLRLWVWAVRDWLTTSCFTHVEPPASARREEILNRRL